MQIKLLWESDCVLFTETKPCLFYIIFSHCSSDLNINGQCILILWSLVHSIFLLSSPLGQPTSPRQWISGQAPAGNIRHPNHRIQLAWPRLPPGDGGMDNVYHLTVIRRNKIAGGFWPLERYSRSRPLTTPWPLCVRLMFHPCSNASKPTQIWVSRVGEIDVNLGHGAEMAMKCAECGEAYRSVVREQGSGSPTGTHSYRWA